MGVRVLSTAPFQALVPDPATVIMSHPTPPFILAIDRTRRPRGRSAMQSRVVLPLGGPCPPGDGACPWGGFVGGFVRGFGNAAREYASIGGSQIDIGCKL